MSATLAAPSFAPAPASTPAHATHDVRLRPLLASGLTTFETGLIVTATEESFVDALAADLAAPNWQDLLTGRLPQQFGSDGVAELAQPVHRVHHLVVLEAYCDQPGTPRLDARKIDSMGLVLRRADGDGGWLGWLANRARRGWLPLPPPTATEAATGVDPDPDPTRRRLRPGTGHATLDALIAARDAALPAEQVLKLFAAPPAVCAALGKTVLLGLVPLASSEFSDQAPRAADYVSDSQQDGGALIGHLSAFLKARPATTLPNAGQPLDPTWLDTPPDPADDTDATRIQYFGLLVRQMTVELGAFSGSPQGNALLALFQPIVLPTTAADGSATTVSAADFLPLAAAILVNRGANTLGLVMPQSWPAVDPVTGANLTNAALACLDAQYAQLVPHIGKLDGADTQYCVRAFLRVREDPACPPRLIWGQPSMPFRIRAWWDGDAPPATIPLPDVTDSAVLAKLKPGVSFQLPPPLANLLRKIPNNVLSDTSKLTGANSSKGGMTIFWLCSFSIPTITICAFIVLNIFLSLFDLIFSWMAFIKICIPIPLPKKGAP